MYRSTSKKILNSKNINYKCVYKWAPRTEKNLILPRKQQQCIIAAAQTCSQPDLQALLQESCLPKLFLSWLCFACQKLYSLLLASALESGDCLRTVCAVFSSAEFEFLSLGLTGYSSLIGLLSKCPGITMAQAFSSSSSFIHYTYPWQLQLLLKRKQRH